MKTFFRTVLGWVVAFGLVGWDSGRAAGQQRPSPAQLERRFDHEPTVTQVQRAALGASGYRMGDLDDWSTRARWSHLLPKVSAEVLWLDQHDVETRYQEDIETNDVGQMHRDSARNYFIDDSRLRSIYALELDWELSGLVYDPAEASIAREVRARRKARRKLLIQVAELYFERRQRQLLLILTARSQWRKRLDLYIDLRQLTAQLDALTGQWFSRQLRKTKEAQR